MLIRSNLLWNLAQQLDQLKVLHIKEQLSERTFYMLAEIDRCVCARVHVCLTTHGWRPDPLIVSRWLSGRITDTTHTRCDLCKRLSSESSCHPELPTTCHIHSIKHHKLLKMEAPSIRLCLAAFMRNKNTNSFGGRKSWWWNMLGSRTHLVKLLVNSANSITRHNYIMEIITLRSLC